MDALPVVSGPLSSSSFFKAATPNAARLPITWLASGSKVYLTIRLLLLLNMAQESSQEFFPVS